MGKGVLGGERGKERIESKKLCDEELSSNVSAVCFYLGIRLFIGWVFPLSPPLPSLADVLRMDGMG